jgi:hypothetical protein
MGKHVYYFGRFSTAHESRKACSGCGEVIGDGKEHSGKRRGLLPGLPVKSDLKSWLSLLE